MSDWTSLEALKAEVVRRLAGVDGVQGVGIGVGGVRVHVRDGASVDRVIRALPGTEVVIEVVGVIRAGPAGPDDAARAAGSGGG